MRVLTDARARGGVAIAADPSDRRMAVATTDGVLFVNLDDLTVSGPVLGEHGSARAVAYSPDGSMVAAALDDGNVALWDGRSLQPLGAPLPLTRANSLAFSPDGGSLAVLGLGRQCRPGHDRPRSVAPQCLRDRGPAAHTSRVGDLLARTHYDPAC
jgi:WD40 repeat protein